MVVTHMLLTIMFTANYSKPKWDLVTSGFNLRGDWGDDSTNQEYKIGDVVRLGGYTYVATATANSTGVLQIQLTGQDLNPY